MDFPMSQLAATARWMTWRTPAVIILCGCLISLIGFGPRSAFGFFLTPMSAANRWGREVFALAFALQNLLWGGRGARLNGARAERRRAAVCGWPRADGLHDLADHLAGDRRRAGRLRAG